jgi:hypothetical protein
MLFASSIEKNKILKYLTCCSTTSPSFHLTAFNEKYHEKRSETTTMKDAGLENTNGHDSIG